MLEIRSGLGYFGDFPDEVRNMTHREYAESILVTDTASLFNGVADPLVYQDTIKIELPDDTAKSSHVLKLANDLNHRFKFLSIAAGSEFILLHVKIDDALDQSRRVYKFIDHRAQAAGLDRDSLDILLVPSTKFNAGARPRPLGGNIITMNYGLVEYVALMINLMCFTYVANQMGLEEMRSVPVEDYPVADSIFDALIGGPFGAAYGEPVSSNMMNGLLTLTSKYLDLDCVRGVDSAAPVIPSGAWGIQLADQVLGGNDARAKMQAAQDLGAAESKLMAGSWAYHALLSTYIGFHELGHVLSGHTQRIRNWKPIQKLTSEDALERFAIMRQFEYEADEYSLNSLCKMPGMPNKDAACEGVIAFLFLLALVECAAPLRRTQNVSSTHPMFWLRVKHLLNTNIVRQAIPETHRGRMLDSISGLMGMLLDAGLIVDPSDLSPGT